MDIVELDDNVFSDPTFVKFLDLLEEDTSAIQSGDSTTHGRFANALTPSELDHHINNTISADSLAKVKWAVNVFKEWFKHRQSQGIIKSLHVFKSFEEMSKSELNSQLMYFVYCGSAQLPFKKTEDRSGRRYKNQISFTFN